MASVGPANSENEARATWVSAYPFEPYGGGQGASLTASTATSRVAMVGTTATVNSALIINTGTVWVNVQVGNSTVTATTSSMAIPPGAYALISLTTQGSPVPTHLAAITTTGTAVVQVTLGYGGN